MSSNYYLVFIDCPASRVWDYPEQDLVEQALQRLSKQYYPSRSFQISKNAVLVKPKKGNERTIESILHSIIGEEIDKRGLSHMGYELFVLPFELDRLSYGLRKEYEKELSYLENLDFSQTSIMENDEEQPDDVTEEDEDLYEEDLAIMEFLAVDKYVREQISNTVKILMNQEKEYELNQSLTSIAYEFLDALPYSILPEWKLPLDDFKLYVHTKNLYAELEYGNNISMVEIDPKTNKFYEKDYDVISLKSGGVEDGDAFTNVFFETSMALDYNNFTFDHSVIERWCEDFLSCCYGKIELSFKEKDLS